VTTPPFAVARLDGLDRLEGEYAVIPVRIPLGISAFGVNAYAATQDGGQVIEEHDELGAGAGGHEELYVVVSGHARFTVDGEEIDAPSGTLVFVRDPAAKRTAHAAEAGTTVLAVGAAPGKAFEPSPWESWFEALPHYRAGEYDRAVEILRRALEKYPDNPNVLYNLACCEALAGSKAKALAHLARSVELEPKHREYARTDSDLDAIRSEDGFPV
jgi:tetratricopeptide (TPR) repeat protein